MKKPQIQGNIILLMEQAQNEAKKIGYKKINCNTILLVLTSDISPQSKLLLEKHGINYKKLFEKFKVKKRI